MRQTIEDKKFELFSISPLLEELGVSIKAIKLDEERPDFSFEYKGKKIGLEETKCKYRKRYYVNDNVIHAVLHSIRPELEERGESRISMKIYFKENVYKRINFNEEELKQEIWSHYENQSANKKYIEKLIIEHVDSEFIQIQMFLNKEQIEIDPNVIYKSISQKEDRLEGYKQLEKNKDINEYWLVIRMWDNSISYINQSFSEIDTKYDRIYLVSHHEPILRIK